ncbi:tRNA (adenosine(37)-N6)-threonylcarbamoyltransferase complex ATPase subunit type 1 TsaE, partial [Francisella tularensis subsp. holarctica]|nr:tRNA (adenosine(37)-N6)-threonylcarbamoyltransferase complex ATPase subunit type 1 TsaE [Francisella tularensis subsp. holarctica]
RWARYFFNQKYIFFIEWPEKGKGFLTLNTTKVHIKYLAKGRQVDFY